MRYATRYAAYMAMVLAVVGWGGRQRSKPRLGEVERLPRLETVTPEARKLAVVRSYTATVEPFEKVELCAQVQAGTTGLGGMRGVIKAIPKEIDIGRHVKQEQALIELDIADLMADRETKRAMLAQANKALLQAEQAIQVAAAEIKEAEVQIQRYEADVAFKTLKQ